METSNSPISAIIEQGCRLEGSLVFKGTARIAGEFKGNIFTEDTLIVADSGEVEADISADVVILTGAIKGTIRAKSRVEMRKPGRFEGKILAPSLMVEEGVIFHGETLVSEETVEN